MYICLEASVKGRWQMEFSRAWEGFNPGEWNEKVNVSDFIKRNYTEYTGDSSFLSGATERTKELMEKFSKLLDKERENGGVLSVDTETVSSLVTYAPGYLDKEKELIVGLQTDSPLRRGVNPFGGMRMAREAAKAYGYELSDKIEDEFRYKTTHNDGVFRAYTSEMRKARHIALLTGFARRLRKRQNNRRLSQSCPLRYGYAYRI